MRVQVLNVTRAHGIAERTGNPYEILQLERLVRIEDVHSKNVNKDTGKLVKEYHLESGNKGFTTSSEAISISVFDDLQREFWRYWKPDGGPVIMDVEVDSMSRRPSIIAFKVVLESQNSSASSSDVVDSKSKTSWPNGLKTGT